LPYSRRRDLAEVGEFRLVDDRSLFEPIESDGELGRADVVSL
jgi:hypothetical protein